MNGCSGIEVCLHSFVTCRLDGDEWFSLNGSLDASPPRQSARFEEDGNFMPLPRVEPFDRPGRSLVTVLTMLPQIRLNLKLYFEIAYEFKQCPTGIN
jgi:hypothetical protein